MADDDETRSSVKTTVELSGEYDEIVDILAVDDVEYPELSVVTGDMTAVLDIVAHTGGATKSGIAEELSGSTTADLDAEAVIYVLRVLELYDLVRLDGNTWKPGPALPGQ